MHFSFFSCMTNSEYGIIDSTYIHILISTDKSGTVKNFEQGLNKQFTSSPDLSSDFKQKAMAL